MAPELVLARYTTSGVDEKRSPSTADAAVALDRLDGTTSSELFVTDESTAGICIVGGPDRFVCWVQQWDGDQLALATARDSHPPHGSIEVTLSNGQVDEVSLDTTVDREAAGRALRTYVERRELEASLTWRTDSPPR